ncbi:hypothetical protein MKK64_03635 [Methylobacterium sp. E-025]|uniref:hypothetical protein n=1 Tax=Methylobacterium sp. E-025 TaxID=2836561 RepID=UPI001FBAAAA6|nr:hypothetical protein [Methylobacterium sp. E-025]MCJ2110303.1 hypothetical protein [Methylobacterium sp. E-025]
MDAQIERCALTRSNPLLKTMFLALSLLIAGLSLAPAPASAAQIGIAAIPETAPAVEPVQFGYGYGRGGYGRGGYGRGYRGGYGYGGRGYGGPRFGRGYGGYGRGYGRGRGYRYGRRSFY